MSRSRTDLHKWIMDLFFAVLVNRIIPITCYLSHAIKIKLTVHAWLTASRTEEAHKSAACAILMTDLFRTVFRSSYLSRFW
jgi:hypothetical protein